MTNCSNLSSNQLSFRQLHWQHIFPCLLFGHHLGNPSSPHSFLIPWHQSLAYQESMKCWGLWARETQLRNPISISESVSYSILSHPYCQQMDLWPMEWEALKTPSHISAGQLFTRIKRRHRKYFLSKFSSLAQSVETRNCRKLQKRTAHETV